MTVNLLKGNIAKTIYDSACGACVIIVTQTKNAVISGILELYSSLIPENQSGIIIGYK